MHLALVFTTQMLQVLLNCTMQELCGLMQVPKTALKTLFQQGTVQDVAKRMLQLSRDGLARRGKHEEPFLDPLQEIADVWLPVTTTPGCCMLSDYSDYILMPLLLLFSFMESSLWLSCGWVVTIALAQ